MPRRRIARRFEPRYGVSASMVAEEAKWLGREVEDHEHLAIGEAKQKVQERRGLCERSWNHLKLLLKSVSERERTILHALFYRDSFHILELYLEFVRRKHPEQPKAAVAPSSKTQTDPSKSFPESLFDL